MANHHITDAVSRRNVLKTAGGLLASGVTMSGPVAGHEGGVALLTNPKRRLFHVAKDFEETVSLSADCIADGEYHRYQAQFWTRKTPATYIKRGQRSFLVPANRQLTVTGPVTSGSNGTAVSEDDFDPGDLHELHLLRDCEVETGHTPLKFRDDWRQATFQQVNLGT